MDLLAKLNLIVTGHSKALGIEWERGAVSGAIAEIVRLRAVLTNIAAYHDGLASDRLGSTGSYAAFDEPGAVQTAREALEQ